MPIRYKIERDRRLVISTGWDTLTFDEIMVHREQMTHDPDFDPAFNQLADVSAVADLEVSIDEAKELASRNLFSRKSKRAFVATKPVIFGMLRLMEVYHEISVAPEQVAIFHDRDEAMKWLDAEERSAVLNSGQIS
jgi:hypothetical protein